MRSRPLFIEVEEVDMEEARASSRTDCGPLARVHRSAVGSPCASRGTGHRAAVRRRSHDRSRADGDTRSRGGGRCAVRSWSRCDERGEVRRRVSRPRRERASRSEAWSDLHARRMRGEVGALRVGGCALRRLPRALRPHDAGPAEAAAWPGEDRRGAPQRAPLAGASAHGAATRRRARQRRREA
jgi:hypothetical protein